MTQKKKINWYGLTLKGEQRMCSEEEMMRYAGSTNPQSLNLLWGQEHVVLQDGTRMAKTKRAAEKMGWDDIAKAPFNYDPEDQPMEEDDDSDIEADDRRREGERMDGHFYPSE